MYCPVSGFGVTDRDSQRKSSQVALCLRELDLTRVTYQEWQVHAALWGSWDHGARSDVSGGMALHMHSGADKDLKMREKLSHTIRINRTQNARRRPEWRDGSVCAPRHHL